MLICAEGCFVIPRGGGGGCQTGPRVRGRGARGGRSLDRSPGPRWGRPRGEAEGPGGALRAARGYARGVPGHPRGLLELPQTLRGPPSHPRVSPKMRPSFKLAGFIKDKNRFLKNSKSHPELHQASPKGSQEFQRIPQVASTVPPRVPQGTPKSPWGVGRASRASLGRHGGRDPWGPWGPLGVIRGPLGALGCQWGLRGSPWGAFEICVFRASQTRAQSSPEPPGLPRTPSVPPGDQKNTRLFSGLDLVRCTDTREKGSRDSVCARMRARRI